MLVSVLQITGYDDQSIMVDNMVYPPSLVIFTKQAFVWEVLTLQSLSIDDFSILKHITPKPTYVIVGVKEVAAFCPKIYSDLETRF